MLFIIGLLKVVLVIVCLLLVLLVLMQRPKQEGLGAAFAQGMMNEIGGAHTANILQKGTTYLGIMFFGISLALSMLISRDADATSGGPGDAAIEAAGKLEDNPTTPEIPEPPTGGNPPTEPEIPVPPTGGDTPTEPETPEPPTGGDTPTEPETPEPPTSGDTPTEPETPEPPTGGDTPNEPETPEVSTDGDNDPAAVEAPTTPSDSDTPQPE